MCFKQRSGYFRIIFTSSENWYAVVFSVRIQDGVNGSGAGNAGGSASSHQQNGDKEVSSSPVRTRTQVEELNSGEADISAESTQALKDPSHPHSAAVGA